MSPNCAVRTYRTVISENKKVFNTHEDAITLLYNTHIIEEQIPIH